MFHKALDIFFLLFHSSLVLFNLFGWIWRKTRFYHLITLGLTGLSWSLLGLIAGVPGYCPLTDWHFSILEKMGEKGLPASYMKYLADRITGLDFSSALVDNLILYGFLGALTVSLILNIRDCIKTKSPETK